MPSRSFLAACSLEGNSFEVPVKSSNRGSMARAEAPARTRPTAVGAGSGSVERGRCAEKLSHEGPSLDPFLTPQKAIPRYLDRLGVETYGHFGARGMLANVTQELDGVLTFARFTPNPRVHSTEGDCTKGLRAQSSATNQRASETPKH